MVSMGRALDRQNAAVRGPDLKLFIKDVRDRQQRKRAITIRSWSTIQEVKHVIQKIMHVPPNAQRLYFGPLLSSGGELPNHRTLHDAGIYRSGETLLLDIKVANSSSPYSTLRASEGNDVCISSSMIDSTSKPLRSLVQKARRGFLMGLKPELVLEGSGGTYFLHDAQKAKIAVFKPADEEPYAENNPRGYIKQAGQAMALREGVVPGEACMREVAAFLLDHDGFGGVPMTTLTEARHPAFNNNGSRLKVAQGGASIGSHSISPNSGYSSTNRKKVGSFQEFVRGECTMDDISPSKISTNEVHKIAILDIRIMNADRNAANLLVRRRRDNTLELVPIDHGFCLRTEADVSWMDWCWLDWPQLKKPVSEENARYIMNLDIEADARMLSEQLNITTEAVDYFRSSSRILKAGVQAGLTLYDIAVMCCRNDDLGEIPSKLEILFSMAEDLSLSALENGKWHHSAASRALAEQLSPRRGTLLPQQRRLSMSSFGSRMHKSASSVPFKTIIGDLEVSLAEDDSKKDFPGMAQSSASDSSSEAEAGDVTTEKEECDEWAATLLTNISIDRSMSILNGSALLEGSRRFSSSDSEDDSNDMSPKGFWQKHPDDFDEDDDDHSWTLSPDSSPESSPIHQVEVMNPDTIPMPLLETPLNSGNANRESFRTPTVRFAGETWLAKEKEHALPNRPESLPEDLDPEPTPPPMPSFGARMTRSQSYSAISNLSVPPCTAMVPSQRKTVSRHPSVGTEEYEQFRDYFLKFVDLVIVRETKAACMQSQINHVSG